MGLQLFGCVDFSANFGNIVNKDNKVPRHVSPEFPVWAWLKNADHSMHLSFSFETKKNNGGPKPPNSSMVDIYQLFGL